MLKRFGWLLACGCMALACSGDDEGDDTSATEQSSGGGDKGGGGTGGGDKGGGGDTGSGDTGAGGGGDTGGGGGGDTGGGRTPCGNFPDLQDKFCQAGQYCEDMTISSCASGCLSDNNCANNQTCAKEDGENVGSCQNKPGSVDAACDAVCAKMQACDPMVTAEQCNQFCAGVSSECRACVADANCADPEECWSVCGFD